MCPAQSSYRAQETFFLYETPHRAQKKLFLHETPHRAQKKLFLHEAPAEGSTTAFLIPRPVFPLKRVSQISIYAVRPDHSSKLGSHMNFLSLRPIAGSP